MAFKFIYRFYSSNCLHRYIHYHCYYCQATLGSEADKLTFDAATGSIQVESINGVKIDVTMDNLVVGVAVGVMSDLQGAHVQLVGAVCLFACFNVQFKVLLNN